MDLTEDQLEKIRQDSIHERLVVGSDIRKLITELRSNKSLVKEMYQYRQEAINERELSEKIVSEREELCLQVEEMEKTLQDIHDKLNNGASHEFEETIQYCITKAFYTLQSLKSKEK